MHRLPPSRGSSLLGAVLAVAGVLALLSAGGAAGAPQLTVDGKVVALSAPLLRVGNETYAPLQPFAEAVGAQWAYYPETGLIRLTRNELSVRLWVGQKLLVVNNDIPEATTVAPILDKEVPQVPLSVVAKGWGAGYSWDNAKQIAALTLPTGPLPPPTGGSVVTGMLLQVYPGPPPVFLVQRTAGGTAQAYVAAAQIVYLRSLEGEPSQTVTRDALRGGDQVRLTLNAQSQVLQLLATYRERSGQLKALGENRLILADGTTLNLGAGVQVHTPEGEELDLASLPAGAPLTIRYNQAFNQVWEIIAARPTQPQEQTVQLLSVAPVNYTRPLRAGEKLQVLIQGTAGATVKFSIGEKYQNLPTTEKPAGRYTGQFVVPTDANLTNAVLSATLTKGGKTAEPLAAEQKITLDTVPPTVTGPVPAANSTIANTKPALAVRLADPGSGIDVESVRFLLDGKALTGDQAIAGGRAAIQAPVVKAGVHQAELAVKDKAGNEQVFRWNFTVTPVAGSPLVAVTHSGLAPLGEGETLTVEALATARLTNPVADLGTWKTGLPLAEVSSQGGSFLYRMTYKVRAGDKMEGGPVTVRAKDAANRDVQLAATVFLIIRTGLPQGLTIVQPTEGATAPRNLTVAGLAPPGATVRVTVKYVTKVVIEFAGQVSQVTATADEEGKWQTEPVDLRLPLFGTADKYQVVAELLGQDGTALQTETINLKGK